METGIQAEIEAMATALQPQEVFIRTAMAALVTKMTVTINHTTEDSYHRESDHYKIKKIIFFFFKMHFFPKNNEQK